MLLFDLKEGYCTRNARLAKRFCCKAVGPALGGGGKEFMVMSQLMNHECKEWRSWGEVWGKWMGGAGEGEKGAVNYLAYILIAVRFSFSTLSPPLSSLADPLPPPPPSDPLLHHRLDAHHLPHLVHLGLLLQRLTFDASSRILTRVPLLDDDIWYQPRRRREWFGGG